MSANSSTSFLFVVKVTNSCTIRERIWHWSCYSCKQLVKHISTAEADVHTSHGINSRSHSSKRRHHAEEWDELWQPGVQVLLRFGGCAWVHQQRGPQVSHVCGQPCATHSIPQQARAVAPRGRWRQSSRRSLPGPDSQRTARRWALVPWPRPPLAVRRPSHHQTPAIRTTSGRPGSEDSGAPVFRSWQRFRSLTSDYKRHRSPIPPGTTTEVLRPLLFLAAGQGMRFQDPEGYRHLQKKQDRKGRQGQLQSRPPPKNRKQATQGRRKPRSVKSQWTSLFSLRRQFCVACNETISLPRSKSSKASKATQRSLTTANVLASGTTASRRPVLSANWTRSSIRIL